MVELRHIRYFEAVAAERNFTRAAERLGVAQPPLSRQIRELELELGVTLFDRESRPIRLTEAGRIFHEQATRILASTEQLRRSMQRLGQSGRRRFVIGFVASIVYGTMPEVVRNFRSQSAGLDIQLLEMTTLEQVAALKDGRIDVALGRIRIDDPAVHREILQEEPLVAAIGSADPLAQANMISLADLMTRRLLVYPSQPRPSYADQVLTILRDHGLAHQDVEEVRDVQVALGLVASEAGLALVPSSMRHVQREDITYVPIADENVTSPVILSLRASDSSEEVRLFEQLARRSFAIQHAP
jgi:DNA-binding transcriptional LysR family regulator